MLTTFVYLYKLNRFSEIKKKIVSYAYTIRHVLKTDFLGSGDPKTEIANKNQNLFLRSLY